MTQTVREAYYAAVEAGTVTNSEAEYRKFATGWAAAVQAISGPRPVAEGPVIMIDMGSFEMGDRPGERYLCAEVYQTEPQEPPALRHADWKPDPIVTTLEISDGPTEHGSDELIIHEDEDGSVEIMVRSRCADHYQTIDLPPQYAEIIATFLMRRKAPVAYLMLQRQRGRVKLRHDRVWKGQESAKAAADRETGPNREMTPLPVYDMSLLATGLVKPGFKVGNPPTPSPRVAHGTPVAKDGELMHPDIYGAMAASVQTADTGQERVVGKHPALGMGYGTLDEAGQRAYHGLPPEDGQ